MIKKLINKKIVLLLLIFVITLFTVIYNKNKLKRLYYNIVKTEHRQSNKNYRRKVVVPIKNIKKQKRLFNKYKNNVFGVDFSHYQGLVEWAKINNFNNKVTISFAVVRATMGSKAKDNYFTYNWRSAKKYNICRGAYHYYRPNENSTKQAYNFIKRVKLQKGDLPPILDIEQVPEIQSVKSLQVGLKNWLNIVEKHFGVKPIIYSGDKFKRTYLSGSRFKDYIIWVANYNNVNQPKTESWQFWQFTDKGKINGIYEFVDINIFNGTKEEFNKLMIK